MFNKLISKFKKPKGEAAEKPNEKALTVPEYGVFLRTKEGILYTQPLIMDVYRDIPTIHATTKYLATNAAQVPLKFYDWQTDKPIDGDDKVAKLFRKPNADMSMSDLVEAFASWYILDGEFFLYYKDGGFNQFPKGILTPSPRLMRIDSLDNDGNVLTWKYNNKITMPETLITHIKSFNTNGSRGIGISSIGRPDIETDYYASQHQKKFFENSAIPEGLLELPLGTTPEEAEEILEIWNKHHKGTSNSSTIGALVGSKWVQTTVSNREAQFLETRRDLRDSILLYMLVNKAAMGVSEKVDRATAEVAERQVWRNNIRPMLLKLENRLNSDFFPLFAPNRYCKFDFSGIEALHQNRQEQAEIATRLLNAGAATLNQLHRDYPNVIPDPSEVDDGMADVRFIPTSVIPANDMYVEEPTPEPTPEPEPEPEKVIKKELSDRREKGRRQALAQEKVIRKHEKVMYGKLRKYLFEQRNGLLDILNGKKDIKTITITADISNFMNEQNTKLHKVMKPLYEGVVKDGADVAAAGLKEGAKAHYSQTIVNNRLAFITKLNTSVKKEIVDQIKVGVDVGESITQLENRIKTFYNQKTSYLTRRVARTESSHMVSASAFETYKENDVKYKSIATANDDHVRDTHTQNEAAGNIPIDQPFPGTGEMFAAESEINCRCTTIGEY